MSSSALFTRCSSQMSTLPPHRSCCTTVSFDISQKFCSWDRKGDYKTVYITLCKEITFYLIVDSKTAEYINVLIGLVFTFVDNEHNNALKIYKVPILAALKQKHL